jgi:hypothetical protein
MIVLDIVAESMVGHAPQAIVRPGARRLNSKHPESLKNYNRVMEELLTVGGTHKHKDNTASEKFLRAFLRGRLREL